MTCSYVHVFHSHVTLYLLSLNSNSVWSSLVRCEDFLWRHACTILLSALEDQSRNKAFRNFNLQTFRASRMYNGEMIFVVINISSCYCFLMTLKSPKWNCCYFLLLCNKPCLWEINKKKNLFVTITWRAFFLSRINWYFMYKSTDISMKQLFHGNGNNNYFYRCHFSHTSI